MAKAIFLDVDGVLCTARSYFAYDIPRKHRMWNSWDELACTTLREVCKKGIQIVVSSTWRQPLHEVELKEHMTKHGLIEFLRLPDWKTPDLFGEGRGLEIKDYLSHNPDIEDYKILDDVDQFLEEQANKVILTDPENGMSAENIRKLYRWSGVLKA